MPLFGGKNKFKADPPKIRVEKVVVPPKPVAVKPKSRLNPTTSTAPRPSSRSPLASSNPILRQKSQSPYPSSSDERRKRKAPSSARPSPAPPTRVEFDKDSDAEDDEWMTLETRKRRRKEGVVGDLNRRLTNPRSFDPKQKGLELIHAAQVASLASGCEPVMGATANEASIKLQYPSLQPPERFELVWGKDKIDAVEASIRVVRHVAETFLTEEQAKPFMDQASGIVRRLEKASNRNVQDLSGYKAALQEYNEKLLALVKEGSIAKNLDALHELPRHLVAFLLDQIYDRTVAPKVELLSKYENGTDFVYGELNHSFITRILVEQTSMTSDQVFVDLGSGVGNVVLQAALEIGCESWGCEMMDNACDLAEAQKKEFDARCVLWGLQPGKAQLERGDFRKNSLIHNALQRADVVLVNNKAFTSQLNDDLIRMFLDLKTGCKIISLKSFVADSKSSHNINDVGSTILEVDEHAYPEGFVSWTNAGGPYFIATRK